jgi:Spy/CpxP family protein refolding chaperone
MKLKKMIAATFLMAVVVMAGSHGAFAQDKACCPSKGAGMECQGKGAGMPDLTPDQQKQIETLKTAFMKDAMALKNQIAEKKAHLRTLSTVDEPNMAEINKTIDEMYTLKASLEKKKAEHIQAVRKVLTPEQRLMFDMKMAKGCEGGKGHGMGMGCGDDEQGMGCQGGGQMKCGNAGAGAGCQGDGQMKCGNAGAGAGCKGDGQMKCGNAGAGAGCKGGGQGMGSGQGCQHQSQTCPSKTGTDTKK